MHVRLVSWGVGISFPFFFDRKEDDLMVQEDITFIKLELSFQVFFESCFPLELKSSPVISPSEMKSNVHKKSIMYVYCAGVFSSYRTL